MTAETFDLEPSPPARRRWRPLTVVAVVVGVLAVLAAAAFAAATLGDDGEGAGDPEGAVDRLLEAVADEDILGVLEAVAPGERESLREPLTDIAGELRRIGVLGEEFELGDVEGVDFEFEDAEMSSETVADGLAVVRLTGGTVRSSVDPAAVPLGDLVRDLAGAALANAGVQSETEALGDGDGFIATVEDGDGWYVSFWYTVAEAARREAGAPVPSADDAVPATGAASPEQAVRDLIRAGTDLDVRRIVELTPPDEMAALHDYAPLFLDDAERKIAEVQDDFDIEIEALDVTATRNGDRALVKVHDVSVRATLPDEVTGTSGRSGSSSILYEDGCVTIESGGGSERRCGREGLSQFLQQDDLDIATPEIGFVAVEVDGRWFVSPTRTLLDTVGAVLRVLDDATIDRIVEAFVGVRGGEG